MFFKFNNLILIKNCFVNKKHMIKYNIHHSYMLKLNNETTIIQIKF